MVFDVVRLHLHNFKCVIKSINIQYIQTYTTILCKIIYIFLIRFFIIILYLFYFLNILVLVVKYEIYVSLIFFFKIISANQSTTKNNLYIQYFSSLKQYGSSLFTCTFTIDIFHYIYNHHKYDGIMVNIFIAK